MGKWTRSTRQKLVGLKWCGVTQDLFQAFLPTAQNTLNIFIFLCNENRLNFYNFLYPPLRQIN